MDIGGKHHVGDGERLLRSILAVSAVAQECYQVLQSDIDSRLHSLLLPAPVFEIAHGMAADRGATAHFEKMRRTVASFLCTILYLNLSIMLVGGVVMVDKDIEVSNLLSVAHSPADATLQYFFFDVHLDSCATLAAALAVHVLAARAHRLQRRKLPGRKSLCA